MKKSLDLSGLEINENFLHYFSIGLLFLEKELEKALVQLNI